MEIPDVRANRREIHYHNGRPIEPLFTDDERSVLIGVSGRLLRTDPLRGHPGSAPVHLVVRHARAGPGQRETGRHTRIAGIIFFQSCSTSCGSQTRLRSGLDVTALQVDPNGLFLGVVELQLPRRE